LSISHSESVFPKVVVEVAVGVNHLLRCALRRYKAKVVELSLIIDVEIALLLVVVVVTTPE